MHTHSSFSSDGRASLSDMVAAAKAIGLRCYGVTEHIHGDEPSLAQYGETDAAAYFACARALQERECGENFSFFAGGEYNYAPDPRALDYLVALSEKYRPDFVVNSVHNVDGAKCCHFSYFEGKSKQRAYGRYLEEVRRSLDAPYPYDIVGHLGYVSRSAPYADKKLRYDEFADLFDEILRTVIRRGVILEVNTAASNSGSEFLPDADVLARYFELGGRKISFGSDAHYPSRIGEKRELVCEQLAAIGFTEITVPNRGTHITIGL